MDKRALYAVNAVGTGGAETMLRVWRGKESSDRGKEARECMGEDYRGPVDFEHSV